MDAIKMTYVAPAIECETLNAAGIICASASFSKYNEQNLELD